MPDAVPVTVPVPSISMSPVRLSMPFPMRIRPPQSPGRRCPAGCDEVKTMGASAVPTAWILAPRMTNSDDPSVL